MAKPKIIQLADGTEIVDAAKRLARTSMRAAIPVQTVSAEAQNVLSNASLWWGPKNSVKDSVPVPAADQRPVISDERYIEVEFRALSAIFLENRGLDFSTPGVLEAAVAKLQGKTVYPNHEFGDIYNWLGVVSSSFWDAAGAKAEGVAGINCKVKIDAFLNYRIACGLLMNPPAINSMSLTVVFEYEYSHPQLVEERRFWNLLGEEVDGEIVRLIVVNIIEFWEASLVPVGEDRKAKHQGHEPDEEDYDDDSLSAADEPPANSNEEKTMKLTTEQKQALGIEFDGDDVPETEILKAAERLNAEVVALQTDNVVELKAKSLLADQLLEEKRTEVTRLAKLAELGSAEGELDAVVADTIKDASFERLQGLHAYYQKKAADKLPAGRSSVESKDAVETAGGVQTTEQVKPVTMF